MGRNEEVNLCRLHQHMKYMLKPLPKPIEATIKEVWIGSGAIEHATVQTITYEAKALTSATNSVQYQDRV